MGHQTFERKTLVRVLLPLGVFIVLLLVGAAGFHVLEGMSLLDALYMTVITLSTVGFGEVQPLSPEGRLFTIFLIMGGGGLVAYILTTTAEYIFSTDWQAQMAARRRQKMVDALANHVIVCGFGRVGRYVAHELSEEGLPFIVIDPSEEQMHHAEAAGYMGLRGNAANEHYLEQAGIHRARALVAAANSDAENVFIVLTARGLNPDLYIVARANYEDSEPKLVRAGADHVVLPYRMGGRRMVSMITRPSAANFVDDISRAGGVEWLVDQVSISPLSPLAGKTLAESALSRELGITVLACKPLHGMIITNPAANTRLEAEMGLIVLGTREQIRQFTLLAIGKRTQL